MPVKALHHHLTQALGRAHDVRGVDGLVGGDQHKALAPVRHRGVGRFVCAEDVVFYGLAGAVLHEGHVLVRRRVENELRAIIGKHLLQAAAVAHGAYERHEVEPRVTLAQLELNVVGVIFVNVEYNKRFGAVRGDLAAQLAAYRAAPAGHEDSFARNEVENLIHVYLYRLAPQQVFNGHVLDGVRVHNLPHLAVQHRHLLQFAVGFGAYTENVALFLDSGAGNGENNLVDFVLFDIGEDVVSPADDGHTLHEPVPLVGVVVDDAAHLVARAFRAVEVVEYHLPRRACADEHHALCRRRAAGALEAQHNAIRKSHADGQHELKRDADEVIGHGHVRNLRGRAHDV